MTDIRGHLRERIHLAETERDALRDAADRVRGLHQQHGGHCGTCADENAEAAVWPCPTIRALELPAAVRECGSCGHRGDSHHAEHGCTKYVYRAPGPLPVMCGCRDHGAGA